MIGEILKAAFRKPSNFTRTDPRPGCNHHWIESCSYAICGEPRVLKFIFRCGKCPTFKHVEQVGHQPPEIILYSSGEAKS
jgi:hypothetical protein